MIGKVTLPSGTVAVLNDALEWESSDEDVAAHFNLNFDPRQPADYPSVLGPNGAVGAAARANGGKAEYADPPKPLPPDVVS